jgi:aryl-alcohol dehydrogenase-like predicted oxidoreductase
LDAPQLMIAGVEVARVGLGTNKLTHTPEHISFIRDAVADGLGMIDTAHIYAGGESEQTIGEAPTAGCIVATKGGCNDGRPDVIRAELEESLRRLRVESIELYYLHRADQDVPLEEGLGPISEALEAGKVRSVGVSNVSVEQLERARAVVPVAVVQNHYSYTERAHDDVVDYCAREGLVFVPYFPLRGVGGGAVAGVAARHGVTEAQVALAWLLHRSPMMLPIPGTLSAPHLRENMTALQLELDADDLRALG